MLRRRLTLAFLLVAGCAAGALAIGAYLLVRDTRKSDSLDRAAATLRVDLRQIVAPLTDADVANILDAEERRGRHAIVVAGGLARASNDSISATIPRRLSRRVARGRLAYERIAGSRLLVGGRIARTSDALYLVVGEAAIDRDLRQLRTVLAIGWLAVVLAAALVGGTLATRTLRPVAHGAQAAREIAGGALSTRLSVDRDDEFGAWAGAFNDMAAALEAKIAALTRAQAREQRFTADVAHELRTPLTAMVAAGSILRERLDALAPQERRPIELLIADIDRLARLVEELTEISRLDSGREDVRFEPLDLAELVDATLRSRGWVDLVVVDGGPLRVSSDRRRVERIVANLVDNALEHGGGRVRIELRGDGDGDTATLAVLDDGPGIAPAHVEHVFDRFYKIDPSRTAAGSGLGLAIARENARLLGGDIVLETAPGAGCRFEVRLPVTRSLPTRRPAVADGEHSAARP